MTKTELKLELTKSITRLSRLRWTVAWPKAQTTRLAGIQHNNENEKMLSASVLMLRMAVNDMEWTLFGPVKQSKYEGKTEPPSELRYHRTGDGGVGWIQEKNAPILTPLQLFYPKLSS